jgi:hypothetical protein
VRHRWHCHTHARGCDGGGVNSTGLAEKSGTNAFDGSKGGIVKKDIELGA